MFQNYVRSPVTDSAVNHLMVRFVFGGYLIWKLSSLHLGGMEALPPVYESHSLLFPGDPSRYLWIERWIAVLGSLSFIAGYRPRVSAYFTALLTAHIGIAVWMYNMSGTTQAYFMASMFLIIYALYVDTDPTTLENVRSIRRSASIRIRESNTEPRSTSFRYPHLRVFLAIVGIVYFGSGLEKLLRVGPSWASPTNMGRRMQSTQAGRGYDPLLGEVVLNSPELLGLGAAITVLAEIGLLIAIVLGVGFSLTVVLLIGFHVAVLVVMGPIFLDHSIFLLLFLRWDAVASAFDPSEKPTVRFDPDSHAGLVHWLRSLETSSTIDWKPHSAVGETSAEEAKKPFEVQDGGQTKTGFEAVRSVFRNIGILRPVAVLLGFPIVSSLGSWIYDRRYVPRHQS